MQLCAQSNRAAIIQTIFKRDSGVTDYRYIENIYIPPVYVCERCGLVEEKERMTPIWNTYENEQRSRLKPGYDYPLITDAQLSKLAVRMRCE
jgi:hypothetical protein